MLTLPIDAVLPSLLAVFQTHTQAILQAPPGSGKTTRVPLALLKESALPPHQKIIMLEPRRLAARAAAHYMATLLGEQVGHTVGYRTRLDSKVSAATRIEVVTEGILTRLLQDDPALSAYGFVIFDEFHERSLQADLGLALVLECQQVLREDLRLLVMSATLDATRLQQLLPQAPVFSAEGRQYPVETSYFPLPKNKPLLDHVAALTQQALQREEGSILVFLPGEGEIRRVLARLENTLPEDTDLMPLFGQLSTEAQDQAIRPAKTGRRKVVLATALAETSLTIDGIRIVIDAGQQRLPCYNPNSAMTQLITQRVSAASAEQRRGRAGRLMAGICYRLWSEDEQARLQPFSSPEIMQADLAGTVLELAQWGVRDPAALAWLDTPPLANWQQACDSLKKMAALTAQGEITAHGKAILTLGLPPRLAHMVLHGRTLGWGRLAAELAALLAERDLFPRGSDSDIHDRLAVLRGEQQLDTIDRGRLQRVREGARRLQTSIVNTRPEQHDTVGFLLALAYPDFIAQRRKGSEARYRLANGSGAYLNGEDRLAAEEWLVAAALDGADREAKIFLAAALTRDTLMQLPADWRSNHDVLMWDSGSDSVQARVQCRLGALVLDDKPQAIPPAEKVTALLCAALSEAGLQKLPWTPALRQWQARVQWMRTLAPTEWPDVSDTALLQQLATWATPFLDGMTRFSHLANFPLQTALQSLLSWDKQQQLDQLLPSHYTVPSGSSIAIDYVAEHGPVLAVKLQEMFGLQETPRLAQGRLPLLIHLLSPAQRPVAVTQDLASFWKNAYADVRKDLRGRYPKHPWPEDPCSAVAQRGVKHPKAEKKS